ncbi:hypothetical protein KFU94_23935 [Chloroflexi bacterium TSY]|nr:hypothetical protein [Chloroflexi bacterium TSY]
MEVTDGSSTQPVLDYHATSFSQGRMNFAWEELNEEEYQQAYMDWAAGKGLIGGDPRRIPHAQFLPGWALKGHFFRALALHDSRNPWNDQLQTELESQRPLEIEIGFGRGDFLLNRAQNCSKRLFLGYEVKTKAARLCLARVERMGLENLWISDDDVRFSLPRVISDGRVDIVHVLFPDPWWKEQHRVKRLFSPPFVDLLAAKIRVGGLLYFKSDVEEYGELVRYLVGQHADFGAHDPVLASRIGSFALTHREFWCLENDRPIYHYYFERL